MVDFAPDIADTLFVWNVLDQAKNGKHPYGIDIAEVYVKHLLPHSLEVASAADAWKQASRNLHTVLRNFCDLNCVKASIDGIEVGDWLDNYELKHKCDVRIYREEPQPVITILKPKNKKKRKKEK